MFSWSVEELNMLADAVEEEMVGDVENWEAVARKVSSQLSPERGKAITPAHCKRKWQRVRNAKVAWTMEEEARLILAHKVYTHHDCHTDWEKVAHYVGHKTALADGCEQRYFVLSRDEPKRFAQIDSELPRKPHYTGVQLFAQAITAREEGKEKKKQLGIVDLGKGETTKYIALRWKEMTMEEQSVYEKEATSRREEVLDLYTRMRERPLPKRARFENDTATDL